MKDAHTHGVLAVLGGFMLGSAVADAFREVTDVLVSAAGICALVAGGIAAARGHDVARWTAVGGLCGVVLGALILLADLFVGA